MKLLDRACGTALGIREMPQALSGVWLDGRKAVSCTGVQIRCAISSSVPPTQQGISLSKPDGIARQSASKSTSVTVMSLNGH